VGFSISFIDSLDERPYDDLQVRAARGLLILGASSEGFLANLGEWGREFYQKQWKESLVSLVGGEQKVALITTYSNPLIASHIECWALYRDGDTVHAQNHLLFYDNLGRTFSVESASKFLRERETRDEDGALISEWAVPFEDVRSFTERLVRLT
jgi:hypothetical protein